VSEQLRERVVAAVGDQYDIETEVGRGGMSIVYRALDRRLNRHVAIKVLPPEFAFDPAVRERFRREAQTAAQLNHPNIVPIHSVDDRRDSGLRTAPWRRRRSLPGRPRNEWGRCWGG
jgi:serine/threonine-protein kinase